MLRNCILNQNKDILIILFISHKIIRRNLCVFEFMLSTPFLSLDIPAFVKQINSDVSI